MRTIDLLVQGQKIEVAGTGYESEVRATIHSVDAHRLLFTLRESMGQADFQKAIQTVMDNPPK